MPTRSLCLYLASWLLFLNAITAVRTQTVAQAVAEDETPLFARENLVAWCIVPFDSKQRGPEERAAMLRELGFTKFAYDYRAEHIPTFDLEIESLKKQGVELTAWWFPTTLNDEARMTLEVFARHQVTPQLWVTGGGAPTKDEADQKARVVAEAARIRPIAEAAAKIGCQVGLYNHGGWFGEPENQIAIIEELKLPNVGIVYNQHHGHDHLDRFAELLQKMKPYLLVLNLNGMEPEGDRRGRKILPLGAGELDLQLLKVVRDSGYDGPIGILGHTQDDAKQRLQDNLDGLDWLLPQLHGQPARPLPKYRTVIPVAAPEQAPGPAAAAGKAELVPGRFGKALNGAAGGVFIQARPEQRNAPMTVDCWAKLSSRSGFNILVASEPKSSATHWEMYSYAGTGEFSVYLPGRGGEYRSGVNIADDQWHHVAMNLEPRRIKLFVDGRLCVDKPLPGDPQNSSSGLMAFGRLVEGGIGCAGLIDEVRLRTGAITFDQLPDTPAIVDATTIGLWRFDELTTGANGMIIRDHSSLNLPATTTAAVIRDAAMIATVQKSPQKPAVPAHWGRGEVGFEGWEDDWADIRWQQAEVGDWLGAVVALAQGPYRKALNIRVGDQRQGTVCFDTQHLALRAAWNGFLKFDPARFGIIGSPRPDGEVLFTMPEQAGWSGSQLQYRGMHVNGHRVVLSYVVDGVEIRESPWLQMTESGPVFTRTIEVGPTTVELQCVLADLPMNSGRASVAVHVTGSHAPIVTSQNSSDRQRTVLNVRANAQTQVISISYTSPSPDASEVLPSIQSTPDSLRLLTQPGAARWPERVETIGNAAATDAAYVVDTLTLPLDNPWQALMFTSGHDFLSNGDILVCTVHGDVWRVRGTASLPTSPEAESRETSFPLEWQRIATGLHQPLGLVVQRTASQDRVYVLGRDQITQLHDLNGDGETDFYECFSNVYPTSAGGHDYITCLERDAEGCFWFVHATQGVVKVSADGRTMDVVSTGLRNPNGMGLGPGNVVTASPQEGDWTPASAIFVAKNGAHFGGGGPRVTTQRPLGYDPPLIWIPRRVDNSSGGQVWVTSDQWGPLQGQMLHLSFGQCSLMLVGTESPLTQPESPQSAFLVEFPFRFDSGVMRGRFSPHDGQLYVTGLRGWTSAASVDGCLQRVRYTGQSVDLPVHQQTFANGIALTFTEPLDRDTAEQPGNYHLEQWNYKYSKSYGSPEYRVSDSRQEGRDTVRVRSATLLDPRTVFLELKQVQPVNMLSISCVLKNAETGREFRRTVYSTIHSVPTSAIEESRLARRSTASAAEEDQLNNLQPGLIARFTSRAAATADQSATDVVQETDTRIDRMAATLVKRGTPATPFLEPGPFTATWEGFIRIPLQQTVTFSIQGRGEAALSVNDHVVASQVALDSQPVTMGQPVSLNGGINRLKLQYSSPIDADAVVRLLWESPEFAQEPVPPTVLSCDGEDDALLVAEQLRRGRYLFASLRCDACHGNTDRAAFSEEVRNIAAELVSDAPNLAGTGRLRTEWLKNWIQHPVHLNNEGRMPQLNVTASEAADIAAWLQGRAEDHSVESETNDGDAEAGGIAYEELGCISCHRLRESGVDEFQRRSLNHVADKFSTGQLAAFLQEPHRFFPGSRMPDFHLEQRTAAALASFLIANTAQKSVEPSPAAEPVTDSAERGERLFQERGCMLCHAVGDTPVRIAEQPVALVDVASAGGCLAVEPHQRAGVPHYALTPADQAALVRFIRTDRSSLARSAVSEAAQLLTTSLKCAACHDRDLFRSSRGVIISEEGSRGLIPEALPNLTWTGEKLHAHWVRPFIAGDAVHGSPAVVRGSPDPAPVVQRSPDPAHAAMRPWLKSRMPGFPAYADILASGLAAEHGVAADESHGMTVNSELAELGNQLSQRTALDCRQCHAVGSQPALGDDRTKIAPGINFAVVGERLRYDYYQRFTLDPPRFDINSRMPKLAADGRTTKVTTILNGDARQQFDAVWHFIHSNR